MQNIVYRIRIMNYNKVVVQNSEVIIPKETSLLLVSAQKSANNIANCDIVMI